MTYYTKRNRIRRGSTQSHPKGQSGSTEKKNPFRGIAVPSRIIPKHARHIEGARDTRPTFHTHHRDQCYRALVDQTIVTPTHFDSNPIPCVFLP